jgi:hypothetical protein
MHREEIHGPGRRSDVEIDETAELLGLSGDQLSVNPRSVLSG